MTLLLIIVGIPAAILAPVLWALIVMPEIWRDNLGDLWRLIRGEWNRHD